MSRVERALRASAVVAVLVLGLMAALGAFGADTSPFTVPLIAVPYVVCVVFCVRPSRPRRAAWTVAGAAMTAALAGAVWAGLAPVERGEPVHTVVTDTLSGISLVLLYLFVGLLLRADRPAFARGMWLDGVVAGLGIAALACVGGPGQAGGIGEHLAGVLVYLVLILHVVIGGTLGGGRLDRTHAIVVAGFSAASIAEGLALLGHVSGSLAEPGYLIALSLVLPTALAFTPALAPPRRRTGDAAESSVVGWTTLAVPAFFALSSVLLLAIGQSGQLPMLTSVLAVACVLAAFGRASMTFRELRDLRDVYQQARTDDLTGLPNRRALYEHLDGLAAAPASLLLLDLDGFKEVNDSVGHAAGDQVLVQTAERIKVVLSPTQVLARLGGDEFAILLPGATLAEAADLAWRIHVAVTCPSHLGDTQIRLGVSIGVTGTHLADTGSGELLRTADIAMYVAKRRGGGVAAYEPPTERVARPARVAELDPHLTPLP
ncbi:GGDEF domain-containing protein [Asanoa iriomotensis]|uniref:GGDEF domain-containing protein n=1 Tax=Asanoa iriomotensis TaxID=234613 RepID=A0ABQ4CFB8_9ACTN|nr:GGDEF domain-containing protein [Asanoa iriomotensis]GIF61454.1 hypothetical protein Air01nite_75490 [Asanoa iriomotensis]